MGYFKAGSLPSLIMGLIFGSLLLCSGWVMTHKSSLAYFASVTLTGILTLFFVYRTVMTLALFPAGIMAAISAGILFYTIYTK